MQKTKAVLLVIDMQEGFMKPHMARLPQLIADFLPQWQKRGGDVIFTRYINYPGSPCEQYLHWTEMHEGPETEICKTLQPFAETVIDKSFYTALTPELRSMAEERGWETVVCCGTDTAACVQKTALDVFDWGKRPFVIGELCMSGAGEKEHEAALIALKRAIGADQVGNGKEALELL